MYPKSINSIRTPLKHLKLTRINVLILTHLETGNKKPKSCKDMDHNKNYQDSFIRNNPPSKPSTQPTHSKKYATLESFVNCHYIASELKAKHKCNRSIRSKLTCTYYFYTQKVNTRSCTLFQNLQLQSHSSSASNHASKMSPRETQGI